MLKKILKIIVIVFATIIFLFVGLATYLFVFFEPDSYRSEIQEQVNQATGLDVQINDYIGWSFYPILGIEVRGIALPDPVQKDQEIFRLQQLKLGLAILPLFRGSLEVDQIVIDGLYLNARTDAKGNHNWSPLLAKFSSKNKPSEPKQEEPKKASSDLNFSLSGLSFVNTRIVYENLQAGFRAEVEDFSFTTENFAFGTESSFEIGFAGRFDDLKKEQTHKLKGSLNAKLEVAKNLKKFDLASSDLKIQVESPFLAGSTPVRVKISALADLEKETLSVGFLEINLADVLFLRNKTEAVAILQKPVANTSLVLELKDVKKLTELLNPNPLPPSVLKMIEAKPYSFDAEITSKIDLKKDELIVSKLNLSLNNNLKLNGNLYMSQIFRDFRVVLNQQITAKNLLSLSPQKISPGIFKTLPLDGTLKMQLDWKTKKLNLTTFDLKTTGASLALVKTVVSLVPDRLAASGRFSFKTSKAGEIAKIYAPDLFKGEKSKNLSNIRVSTDFAYGGNQAQLKSLSVIVDETKLGGNLSYDLNKKFAYARLSGGKLDLDRYLPVPPPKPKEEKKETPKERKPIVYSKDTLVPTGPLKEFGADAELKFRQIIVKKIPITNLDVKLLSSGGLVQLKKLNFNVYSGKSSSAVTADFRNQGRESIAVRSKTQKIPSGKIMETFLEKKYVDGNANLNIDLNLKGNSVYDFVHSLTGGIRFNYEKGVLYEYNVEQYVCQGIAAINGKKINPKLYPPKTDFRQLDASLKFNQGKANPIAFNSDLAGFQLKGRGVADLPKQNFDFGLSMLVKGNSADPACRVEKRLASMEWPVRCKGVFHGDPIDFCRPDLDKMQDQVAKMIQEAGEKAIREKTEELKKEAEKQVEKEVEKQKKKLEKDLKKEAEKALKDLLPF